MVDPLSTSVWRQLYPKHLSQSRQVGGWGSPASDPHRETLIYSSWCVLSKSRRGMFVTVVQTHTCGGFAGRLPGSCASVGVGDRAWRVFQPEGAGAHGGREGPGGPPDGKGLCFPHSLLLEHLLRSWERIPKKVSWEDMAG